MRYIPEKKKVMEKVNRKILCQKIVSEDFVFYGIMKKNMVQTGRPQMTI